MLTWSLQPQILPLSAVEHIEEKPLEVFVTSVQQDVLRFDVGVDDAAALVQELQPLQHLGEQAECHTAMWGSPPPPAPGVGHSDRAGCGCSGVKERGADGNCLQ